MWGSNFKMLLLKFIACTVVSNTNVTHFFASIHVEKIKVDYDYFLQFSQIFFTSIQISIFIFFFTIINNSVLNRIKSSFCQIIGEVIYVVNLIEGFYFFTLLIIAVCTRFYLTVGNYNKKLAVQQKPPNNLNIFIIRKRSGRRANN